MCSFLASTLALLLRLPFINFYLALRGPDYTGSRTIGGFDYVHNLLHMTGQFTPQPFVAADNLTVALFNGEIYNYRKLERVLRPHGPPYRSDGEAVLEAYARWGSRFGRHFEGEFAIALFDLRRRRIIAVTDPFGVKPLFVARSDEAFGVSSYRSGLLRAGHDAGSISQLEANHAHVYSFDLAPVPATSGGRAAPSGRPTSFALLRKHVLARWELRQHKTYL